MPRNTLYLVIGALAVAVVALGGYIAYEQANQPGLEIRVDENGVKIDGNG